MKHNGQTKKYIIKHSAILEDKKQRAEQISRFLYFMPSMKSNFSGTKNHSSNEFQFSLVTELGIYRICNTVSLR